MIDRIGELQHEAQDAIAAAASSEQLEQLRVRYLGRKAELPQLLRGVAQLPSDQRGAIGKAANRARQTLEAQIAARGEQLAREELRASLQHDRIDVTLPGAPPQPIGRLHVLTSTRRELEDVFLGLGFTVMEGPEIETVHYNF
ncbi:MAG TPA: phenylalanine--tRNA ligase subunit alpha, partial [Solirubrobacteraceae bacterium]|nr:phenylalanine--tRNA ligase subunit alpha [Solirubrobacteraceae bacterium]